MRPLIVEGMRGLGDNIYQRPFIRAAAARGPVYLSTPWPEFFDDLDGVRFIKPRTELRTQAGNIERQDDGRWSKPPPGAETVTIRYGSADFRRGTLIDAMERALPLDGVPLTFDLPDMGPSPIRSDKPIAVVRPVTVRSEWRNEARNPQPEYVGQIALDLRRTHTVVALAHLAPGQEWALSMPPHDINCTMGQLSVRQALALIKAAHVVVGAVGWIVPAAIALKTPAFVVLGGQGGHNAPDKITDSRMDLSRIGWATPDNFCRCETMRHKCDKRISTLREQWEAWKSATLSSGEPAIS